MASSLQSSGPPLRRRRRASDFIKKVGCPLGLRLGSFQQHRPIELRVPERYEDEEVVDDGPLISIVSPSFGQGDFLEATMRSVLEQKYPNLEYIVMDGGSADGSRQIIESYDEQLAYWRSEPDGGQANAINRGFARSTGQIMAWLNCDDRLTPGTLNYVGRYFRDHPDVDAVYGHRIIIDSDNREVGRWILPRYRRGNVVWADYIPQETLFWRRSLWEKAGQRIDEDLDFAIDWELLIRFEQAGARMVRLPRFLGIFTTHAKQKSIAIKEYLGRREFDVVRRRAIGGGAAAAVKYRLLNYVHLASSMGYYWSYRLGLLQY
jgi:glycosyltransferase involved in cell wall biosynthesis